MLGIAGGLVGWWPPRVVWVWFLGFPAGFVLHGVGQLVAGHAWLTVQGWVYAVGSLGVALWLRRDCSGGGA